MASEKAFDAAKLESINLRSEGKFEICMLSSDGVTYRFTFDAATAEKIHAFLGNGLAAMSQNPASP